MRKKYTTAAVLVMVMVGSSAMLGGCLCGPDEDKQVCESPKAGTIVTVNEYCAVNNNDPVDPAIIREWKGQKVGFCCKGCLPRWAKMSDAEKDAAVASAVAKGKVTG
jgi:hypothetical protein